MLERTINGTEAEDQAIQLRYQKKDKQTAFRFFILISWREWPRLPFTARHILTCPPRRDALLTHNEHRLSIYSFLLSPFSGLAARAIPTAAVERTVSSCAFREQRDALAVRPPSLPRRPSRCPILLEPFAPAQEVRRASAGIPFAESCHLGQTPGGPDTPTCTAL